MRLPLRHEPPYRDAPRARCAHLEELADAALGLPLVAAGEGIAKRGGRGRHGGALQWHFGLAAHDGEASPDWEGRIEIKLVSVWCVGSLQSGRVACDKLKVCDAGLDPWKKLANTLWVFADRMTRVVVGHRFTSLSGAFRNCLEASWGADPHFEHPDLFVEPRGRGPSRSPAYYISSRALREFVVDSRLRPSVFDAKWWASARSAGGQGSEPRITVREHRERALACRHCGGPLAVDDAELLAKGWAPTLHSDPDTGSTCVCRVVVDAEQLPRPRACSLEEQRAALECAGHAMADFRLADRVMEPEDHQHGLT